MKASVIMYIITGKPSYSKRQQAGEFMDEQPLYKSIPEEYRNREQTYIKHRVLSQYLHSWAHKMASLAGRSKDGAANLLFIDCFSGPWQSAHEKLEDTSIF